MIVRACSVLSAVGCLLLALSSCSSDEFSTVGSSLPVDVEQDSLAAVLDPPLLPRDQSGVEPDRDQPFEEREIVYLGTRTEGAWRATPLFRFDFSVSQDPSLDLSSGNIRRAELELEMLSADAEKGIQRTVRIHSLVAPLDPSMAEADIEDLLGSEITTITRSGGGVFNLELPDSVVAGWIEIGTHPGVAIYDLTAPSDSSIVGFAGQEFTRFGTLLDPNDVAETAIPEIVLELVEPANTFISYPVLIDLTNFERQKGSDEDLTLGAHISSRIWIDFDVRGSVVPSNATINRALLSLHVRRETTLGTRLKSISTFQAPLDQAGREDTSALEPILRSSASIDVRGADLLSVDVTDFVQRNVNGVIPASDGILLRFDDELLQLDVVDFYGPDAPADSLRPTLSITFTPPADFWE